MMLDVVATTTAKLLCYCVAAAKWRVFLTVVCLVFFFEKTMCLCYVFML
jgi:hypothetical protein